MSKPIILAAFANTGSNNLSHLVQEQIMIEDDLDKYFQVISKGPATIDRIRKEFNKHGEDIQIFHFAGHADPNYQDYHTEDLTGSVQSVNIEGFAEYLGNNKGVKLVFLNGCSTKGQVQSLLDAGIQAVIATEINVRDDFAKKFSQYFYENFVGNAGNNSIESAFNSAKYLLESLDKKGVRLYGENQKNDNQRGSQNRNSGLNRLWKRIDLFRRIQNPSQKQDTGLLERDRISLSTKGFSTEIYVLKTANPTVRNLTYNDLFKEAQKKKNKLKKTIIHPKVHLKVNRFDPNDEFEKYIKKKFEEEPRKPMICVIVTHKDHSPKELSERFAKFTATSTLSKLDKVWDSSAVLEEKILFPHKDVFKKYKEDTFNYFKEEQLWKHFQGNFSGEEITSKNLLKNLGNKHKFISIRHIMLSSNWNNDYAPTFLHEYLCKFWNIKLNEESPRVLILVSVEITYEEWGNSFKGLKSLTADNFPEILFIHKLRLIDKGDIYHWKEECNIDAPMLEDTIFTGEFEDEAPMNYVLKFLKEQVQKRRSINEG